MKILFLRNPIIVGSLLLGFWQAACGSSSKDNPGLNGDDARPSGPVRIPWPSTDRVGLRDSEVPPFSINEQGFVGSGRFNSHFWLDFDGATVTQQDSFIVKNAGLSEVTIPPFESSDIASDADREALKLLIRDELLKLFPDVDITLTLQRPGDNTFSRVHIGGENFTKNQGILGIAPLDLGNRNPDDVLYVYSRVLNDSRDSEKARIELIHAIAHEIAHSLGARHIDNDKAIMRTAVSVQANSFDTVGPVVDQPAETENTLAVLLNSAGSLSALTKDRGLPEIVTLDAFSTGGLIQYTVISKKNFLQNPGKSLAKYNYFWEFDGKTVEGTSVLLSFTDRDPHPLKLTVSDETGATRSFDFIVGH